MPMSAFVKVHLPLSKSCRRQGELAYLMHCNVLSYRHGVLHRTLLSLSDNKSDITRTQAKLCTQVDMEIITPLLVVAIWSK